jgi:hypothetical protein
MEDRGFRKDRGEKNCELLKCKLIAKSKVQIPNKKN